MTNCDMAERRSSGTFGWHPLHVESVAWVAERKDVLCVFFVTLALLSYGVMPEGLKFQIESRWDGMF